MIKIRKSNERGKANYGWLDANYSFSFGDYFDPEYTGFRDLLVLNQDTIEAGGGFAPHPHRDMEIITYIIDGAIEHKDSIGNTGLIQTGEIQRMSAGSGIRHSEYNPSSENNTRLLQIWIQTEKKGITPDYENVKFEKTPGVKLLVSPNGGEKTAKINQDFKLFGVNLREGSSESLKLGPNRHAWIQVISGDVELDGVVLNEGDGAAISDFPDLHFKAMTECEFIVLDLK